MDVQKLERLAQLRIAEREIKAQIDEIMPELVAEADKLDDGTELKVSDGYFRIQKRRTWKYPEYVEKKKAEYDVAKKEAEQKGSATYTEKASLVFTTEPVIPE